MLINLGRLLMLCVWAFLLLNLFQPFPKPLNIFVNVALIFMILMHGLQLTLLKATQPKEAPPLSRFEQIRIFIFGVFELVAWQKKLKATLKNSPEKGSGIGRKRHETLCPYNSTSHDRRRSARDIAARQGETPPPAHRFRGESSLHSASHCLQASPSAAASADR